MIREFRGPYRFLSNFDSGPIVFDGLTFPTIEHAYQAAKTIDSAERARIVSAATPGEAKKRGKTLTLRPGWEDMKVGLMLEFLRQKFRDPVYKAKLLATGNQELQEGNWWGDETWGINLKTGKGLNLLGRLLMQVRAEIREA